MPPSPTSLLKILVFAHTPPPVHGQSVMVATLLEGFRDDDGIELLHVNPRLSRDTSDIGRWRVGKLGALLMACARAWRLRARHGRCVFYYVPAPGKRSAFYRDLIVMLLCRPCFNTRVLHWHAAGLGEWIRFRANAIERVIGHALLGGAQLSIVLGENLRADAAVLDPRQIVVVRNGIPDPCPGFTRPTQHERKHINAVFLGLCSHEKGLFTAMEGVREKNRRASGRPVRLTVAGEFPNPETSREFNALAAKSNGMIRHLGFVHGTQKHELLAEADVLLFPTRYPHETQGLVIAEALAYDLPVITTRWRAVHEGLPKRHIYLVGPFNVRQIANALAEVEHAGPPDGALRQHFLSHLTREHHLARLREVLETLT